jgi:predicted XRE-type DNA-binding protein
MDIRQIVVDRMAQRRITQTLLAELTGITRERINAYVRGHRDFHAKTLARVFSALDLEIRPVRRRKGR